MSKQLGLVLQRFLDEVKRRPGEKPKSGEPKRGTRRWLALEAHVTEATISELFTKPERTPRKETIKAFAGVFARDRHRSNTEEQRKAAVEIEGLLNAAVQEVDLSDVNALEDAQVLSRLQKTTALMTSLADWGVKAQSWTKAKPLDNRTIVKAFGDLLVLAANRGPSGDDTILVTSQSNVDFYQLLAAYRPDWQELLYWVLKSNWNIVHLIRGNERRIRAIRTLINAPYLLTTNGRYDIEYFGEDTKIVSPYDLLVIPGTGSVLVLGTENQREPDLGFFISDRPEYQSRYIGRMTSHVNALRRSCRPAFQTYKDLWSLEYDQSIVATAEQSGSSYMVYDGLSTVTYPRGIDEARSSVIMARQGEDVMSSIYQLRDGRQRRREIFERNITNWVDLDICPKRTIEQLGPDGDLPWDDWLRPYGGHPLSHDQVATLLRNIVRLLKQPDGNYHLALVDDDDLDKVGLVYLNENCWYVKGKKILTVESKVKTPDGEDTVVAFTVQDPAVVDVYNRRFEAIWQEIYDAQYGHQKTIEYLEKRIEHHDKMAEKFRTHGSKDHAS